MTDRREEKTVDLLTYLWKPGYHSNIPVWQYSATKPERKGLKLVAAIIKHKGAKKFRTRASTTALPDLTEFRKPKFQSAYAAEFSDIPVSARSHAAIFQYRKLADLPCSAVLNPIPLRILDQWFSLNDETEYQILVLGTLRSFLAATGATRPKLSESQAQFKTYDYTKLYISHPVGSTTRMTRDTRLSKPWVRPEKPVSYELLPPNSATLDDVKKRRDMLLRGNGEVTKGLVPSSEPVLSQYQHTFVTHFTHYRSRAKPDFSTSISTGHLCPDRSDLVDPATVQTARTRASNYA